MDIQTAGLTTRNTAMTAHNDTQIRPKMCLMLGYDYLFLLSQPYYDSALVGWYIYTYKWSCAVYQLARSRIIIGCLDECLWSATHSTTEGSRSKNNSQQRQREKKTCLIMHDQMRFDMRANTVFGSIMFSQKSVAAEKDDISILWLNCSRASFTLHD